MKKLLSITITTLLLFGLLLSVSAAFADEAITPEDPAPTGAYSWAQLATVAGATAATLLIVQFLKLPLDRVWKIPTRFLVYLIALVITVTAKIATSGLSGSDVFLVLINAFVVALAAMGSYEMTFAKINKQ